METGNARAIVSELLAKHKILLQLGLQQSAKKHLTTFVKPDI
jgi:hypothetical protein